METLLSRLECFDDDGKQEALKYLDKCVTKYFEKNCKDLRKRLEQQHVQKEHIEDLCTLRMLGLGLISVEDAKKKIINPNVRVN